MASKRSDGPEASDGSEPAGNGPAGPEPAGAGPAAAGAGSAAAGGGSAAAGAGSAAARGGAVKGGPGQRGRALAQTGIVIVAAVLLAVLIRTFAFQTFWIPSASMTPTLAVYDRVLVQKAFFGWRDVREGDIVVFSHPPLDQCGGPAERGDLVKRVIALPGQTIYSAGNTIYIDGRPLAEPYLPADDPLGPPIATAQHPYRVPAGQFYLLGDNRADSCDSRYWGTIQGSTIIGKVVLIWWHDSHPDFRRF
jgi:signal peptidase I